MTKRVEPDHLLVKFSCQRKQMWMESRANVRRMMRRKQRAHRKAQMSLSGQRLGSIQKLQSEVQKTTRTAHRRYMEEVVRNYLKENSKRFWSFIKSKRQASTGVAPLMNKDGFLQSDPTKKVKILNQQFQSVYIKEDSGNIQDKGSIPYSSMKDIRSVQME